MPRQCRYFIRGIPQHVITRGVDRQAVFFHEQDYTRYRKALQDAAASNECLIHAYVFMTNPVRVCMVAAPGEYPYSSYVYHAIGTEDAVITAHACYLDLAIDPSARQKAYRKLFHSLIDEELLIRSRKNSNACGVIGDSRFKEQIEAMLGRTVPTGKRGGPRLLQ